MYERWYGVKPDISHLHVFGAKAYAHIPSAKRLKLDLKAEELRFVGYDSNSKAYRLVYISNRKIIVSRDVRFIENEVIDSDQNLSNEDHHDAVQNISCVEIDLRSSEDDNHGDATVIDNNDSMDFSMSDSLMNQSEFLGFPLNDSSANQSDFLGFSETDEIIQEGEISVNEIRLTKELSEDPKTV